MMEIWEKTVKIVYYWCMIALIVLRISCEVYICISFFETQNDMQILD